MKENLEAFVASIGCLPILAIGLFILGAFIGEIIGLEAPAPPQWLLVSTILIPIFSTLYLRAYRKKMNADHWLEYWRKFRRRQRQTPVSTAIEEVWLDSHARTAPGTSRTNRILNNVTFWGWATLVSVLGLAYIFIWFGMMAARR